MPKLVPSSRAVQGRLLRWFDRHRRDLPWRRTRDPYRIWLAEIMLQQTRVPVVIPYYERFIRVYPTVGKLARARLERVLRLWAGLGYYQRARHLHRAAKQLVRRHRGRFPPRLEAALSLPGIGAYTARAVLSIAYGKPVAVVDGNVARVLARLYRLRHTEVNSRGALQPLAERLISRRRPGDFNQALMELGSTICLPRRPRCPLCALEKICAARQAGVEGKFPPRARKRPRPQLRLTVLVARRNGRVLLLREPRGLFSGLWHFPYAPGKNPAPLLRAWGADGERPRGTVIHQTTMRDLLLRVHEAHLRREVGQGFGKRLRWVRPARLERLGIGAATRKIAALVESRQAPVAGKQPSIAPAGRTGHEG